MLHNKQMQRNDKIVCKILNYIPRDRTFEVEDVSTKTKGYVIFVNNYQDIPIMKKAYQKGYSIPLYFDRYEGGVAQFSYKAIGQVPNEEKSEVEIKALFSSSDREFNTILFEALYNSLGTSIDSLEKYNLAKQLLLANKKLQIRGGLAKDLFKMSNLTYQKKFWEEGVLPYFSNFSIRKMWSESNDDEKDAILQRLGISIINNTSTRVNCYFENIAREIVNRIVSAQQSIKIAMAWFTNFDIFNEIKCKLENSNVEVTLVTNNDLINNGGYCLNINNLIDVGMKVYLYEYPDMLHHKFCIIDDRIVLNGSYNWTFFSENVNRENLLVIEDRLVVKAFNTEFENIISGRIKIDKMPEFVLERPEYDRSSFKQYISEELVIRSKHRIGNTRENLMRAKSLSPSYSSVTRAFQEMNITLDNTGISTEALDAAASISAITERREQIASHHQHLQKLVNQKEDIQIQQRGICQKQQEVQSQVRQISENHEISESARTLLQASVQRQKKELMEQQGRLNQSLLQVEQEVNSTTQAVERAEAEISTIKEAIQIETMGGRGSLKINLKWGTTDDLDLHVIDPSSFEIYYGQKEHRCNGVLGKLDIDANAAPPYSRMPQENIFWEEGKNAPVGKYKVSVALYQKRDTVQNISFTVTVYPDKGEVKTFTGKVDTEKARNEVVAFEYSEFGIRYL